ncbi:MAG: DinB family protein [bacterium]|nr:DinB family protein [bacterium]
MLLDFSPVQNGQLKILEFSKGFRVDDLRAAANGSIDTLLEILSGLDDTDVTFDPIDPDANDPYAKEGEENIGWSLAHLVAHVTATCEEWAAYSAVLARGIVYPAEPRLRYETPWRDITTHAQCVQRLEESRRMRMAALDMWPDQPFLDVKRELSPRYVERFGEMNAPACFLFGLYHEVGHYDQFREVRRQVLEAKQARV